MAATAQDIIDGGFSKSAAARPESMTSPAELVARVGQALLEAFLVLARENPYIIGDTDQVDFDGAGWPRPSSFIRVIEVQADTGTIADPPIAPGETISVAPYDDQGFLDDEAALTELGQKFIPTGKAIDPSGGTVTVVGARAPNLPAQASDTIDTLFPEFCYDFLRFDIALFLAEKDKRSEDMQTFAANKSALLALLIEWAQGQTYKIVQRFPIVTAPTTNQDSGRQSGGG